MWKIFDFWVDFVAENSNKLQKLGLEGKKSVEPSMCSHCWVFKIPIMKMWIMKNVITPRPTAQGTLVSNNNKKNHYPLASEAMIGPKS